MTNDPIEGVNAGWGTMYWAIFLAVAIVAFLIPEVWALVTGHPENTLSNFVWVRLNITRNERIGQWSALDFLVFCEWMTMWVWLTWHFFFGRFR